MPNELNVFISSRMRELLAERQVLHELLPKLDTGITRLRAWTFETDALASNSSIRKVYLDALRNASLYIGIFWNEYGEWTIDEFERASEWGIDRHIYVKNVDPEKRDPRLQEFLARQSDVITGITPKWFTTLDELREHIYNSLSIWLQDYLLRRPGDTSALLIESADDLTERPTKLIGRDPLLAKAESLLADGGRVLLQGFSGMGKTAVAASIAANWMENDNNPLLWLRMGSENADTVFEALAITFGQQQQIAAQTGAAKVKAVRTMLQEQNISMLVLDDVWNGPALAQVVKAQPRQMAVLVTAQQRFPVDDILEVGRLAPADALSVLGYYARANFKDNADAAELCHQLGGHAFALEVAGKTLKVERSTPGELLRKIRNSPHQLAMPQDFAEEGRSSITELMDMSLNALDANVRRVFLAFGVLFIPSATPELLAAYLNLSIEAVTEALETLQRRGLTEVERIDDQVRVFGIHDLAFSYVRAIAQQNTYDLPSVLALILAFAREYSQNLSMLDAELGNIFGAANMARQQGDSPTLVAIVEALLERYLAARGHTLPFLDLLDSAIEAARELGADFDQSRHFLLSKRGNTFYERGDLRRAQDRYTQALTLARQLQLTDREIILQSVLGKVLTDQKADNALMVLEEAYAQANALQDEFLIGFVLDQLAYHAQANGDYAATRRYAEESVTLARRVDDSEALFYALLNLGSAEKDTQDVQAALAHHEEALHLADKTDNLIWKAHALQSMGEDLYVLSDIIQGKHYLKQAVSIFESCGQRNKVEEIEAFLQRQDSPISPD